MNRFDVLTPSLLRGRWVMVDCCIITAIIAVFSPHLRSLHSTNHSIKAGGAISAEAFCFFHFWISHFSRNVFAVTLVLVLHTVVHESAPLWFHLLRLSSLPPCVFSCERNKGVLVLVEGWISCFAVVSVTLRSLDMIWLSVQVQGPLTYGQYKRV